MLICANKETDTALTIKVVCQCCEKMSEMLIIWQISRLNLFKPFIQGSVDISPSNFSVLLDISPPAIIVDISTNVSFLLSQIGPCKIVERTE